MPAFLVYKSKYSARICNMNGHGDYHTKWSKADREKEILYSIINMWNLKKNDTNEFIYKTETDS